MALRVGCKTRIKAVWEWNEVLLLVGSSRSLDSCSDLAQFEIFEKKSSELPKLLCNEDIDAAI